MERTLGLYGKICERTNFEDQEEDPSNSDKCISIEKCKRGKLVALLADSQHFGQPKFLVTGPFPQCVRHLVSFLGQDVGYYFQYELFVVNNKTRISTAPDMPTAREQGYPSLEMEGLVGLFGPPGIGDDVRAISEPTAIAMLYDPAYHQAKVEIMSPIREFIRVVRISATSSGAICASIAFRSKSAWKRFTARQWRPKTRRRTKDEGWTLTASVIRHLSSVI